MLYRCLIVVLVVGAACPLALQAKDRPETESAIADAQKSYERKLLESERKYLQERTAARMSYRDAIAEAKRTALKSGCLDEARRLAVLQEQIESELQADRKMMQRLEHQLAEHAALVVRGDGFVLKTLRNDATAYSNRDYKWRNIPQELHGWTYTQIDGGDTPDVTVEIQETGVVKVLAESLELVEEGWTARPELAFSWYPGRPNMRVFSKKVEAGQVLRIPHFGWTGTLVLIPPEMSARTVAATE